MTSVSFPLIPGKAPVDFRFTIATARQLDKAANAGVQHLLEHGQTSEAIVLMTCYGLRHMNPRMTEQQAEALIQQFIDDGGDTTELFKALFEALNQSGVYGKPDTNGSGSANPQPTTETVTTG